MTDILDRLTPIFRDVFDDESIALHPEMTAENIDGWDSLAHIRLILAIERSLNIKFKSSELDGLKTVGEFVEIVRAKV
ncbi:MAG TPA: acyl carrier protein [Burkholderiaceae bacterium]|nr:acyl carrier protein [Burkholderiaceae bacterium]